MGNARAGTGGKLVLLDNHLATGTEATYTYTKTLDMKATYREIKLIITGKATAALSLLMKLNANTNYDQAYLIHDTTTLSGAVGVDGTTMTLLGSSIIDGAVTFYGKISIILDDASDHLCAISKFTAPHEGQERYNTEDQSTDTSITSIEILTSTSTWIAGTEISIYGVKR